MNTMTMTRRVDLGRDGGDGNRPKTGLAGGVAFALAVLVLLAMLPSFAGRGGATPATAPGPLPAPAPSLDAGPVVLP
jgi:hypothetical protein